MDAEHSGRLIRGSNVHATWPIELLSPGNPSIVKECRKNESIIEEYRTYQNMKWFQKEFFLRQRMEQRGIFKSHLLNDEFSKEEEAFLKEVREAEKSLKKWSVDQHIKEINEHIAKRSEALGASGTIAILVRSDNEVVVKYKTKPSENEAIVRNAIAEFRTNISRAHSYQDRLKCVGILYQTLEWIHGFMDGQGRSDLIVLNTLLVQHGLTPVILDDPYFSSISTEKDWIKYLEAGGERWKKRFSEVQAEQRKTIEQRIQKLADLATWPLVLGLSPFREFLEEGAKGLPFKKVHQILLPVLKKCNAILVRKQDGSYSIRENT